MIYTLGGDTMKIAICDDEPHICRQMKAEVNHYYHCLDMLPVTFTSAEQLIAALKREPDNYLCIFMDIELNGMNGMEAARRIRGMGLTIPVILLTSHRKFAMEGYEISAFRFLTKPLVRQKMAEALNAVESMQLQNRKMAIWQDGKEIYIPYQTIRYIKSENVYLRIQSVHQNYLVRDTLKKCMDRLPSLLFCQVHRSYAVNLSHVQSFDGACAIMENDERIPVSRHRQKLFRDSIARYLKEQ